jgi:hypothetical protein
VIEAQCAHCKNAGHDGDQQFGFVFICKSSMGLRVLMFQPGASPWGWHFVVSAPPTDELPAI